MSYVDMFSVGVCYWILCEGDAALVVTMNERGQNLGIPKVLKENTKPDSLARCISSCHILRLNSWECYSGLFLRRPQNKATSDFEGETTNGVVSVDIAGPARVSPTDKVDVCIGATEPKLKVCSPLEVTEDALQSIEVGYSGVRVKLCEGPNGYESWILGRSRSYASQIVLVLVP